MPKVQHAGDQCSECGHWVTELKGTCTRHSIYTDPTDWCRQFKQGESRFLPLPARRFTGAKVKTPVDENV